MERESLEMDVLIVGAGPAGLAAALRLAQLIEQHNAEIDSGARQGRKFSPEEVYVLEKGREIGAHLLSGAVLDPRSLRELVPDFDQPDSSTERPPLTPVQQDAVYFLTEKDHWKFPVTPPFLQNHGNYIISLNRLGRWLGRKVEKAGVSIFTGFAGKELLTENGRVIGVRTDDKGLDKTGNRKSNFEPGYDLHAKVTILAEGPRGSLAKQLIARKGLDQERNPPTYAVGIKELWEIPPQRLAPGTVIHTAGWPLTKKQYGGGWLYSMPEGMISLGLVCGLDYRDPRFDPHEMFQRFKTHPFLRRLLEGGKMLRYGAKTIPEGGWFALPKLVTDGALLVGDCAGFLNSQRLKGIHLAIKTGMLAAETILEALQNNDFSETALADYARRVENSWVKEELWKVRNYHQAFEKGMPRAVFHVGLQMLTGGRGLHKRYPSQADYAKLQKLEDSNLPQPTRFVPDGKLTFDKLTDVYHSSTKHEEDQPGHLLIADTNICNNRCIVEYGNPCQYFCPAAVYEMVEGPRGVGGPSGVAHKEQRLQIHLNPSNCVHCKTCDIMDPYEIITWVPPEGGGGPNYENL
ncbi:MAG: electron transfer flavoprotein-ubiquinone oxidoreductase [Acidobacteria bacterium]|nr:electron transfer flavoprotein-ubiquinone oxidoreductase [Acidobacteriota bacterium]